MSRPLRLVVLGMMGRCPFGGQTWMYLNWLRGLMRLGHEVWYVEDDRTWVYDPVQETVTDDCRYALRHIRSALEKIGLSDRWAFRLIGIPGAHGGIEPAKIKDLYRECDVLLNVCGAVELREEHMAAPHRVYVETDPVTPELRLANGDSKTRTNLARHTALVTYGENYGAPDCGVPLSGLTFHTTRQPIDLELWPMAFNPDARDFTTIGNYRQDGSNITYAGQTYRWSKHHEWEKFIDLPRRTAQSFRLAVYPPDPEDRRHLASHGWNLVPSISMSLDVFGAYPEFIRSSRGEFTVAKDQNVRLRSGWFSERAASYLASGKPVVTQDTGFGCVLPTGRGLFGVRTIEEAVAAIEAINGDYERHCRAARDIAMEYFEATKVAARLLADVGLT